jgi:organic radical activating enzyme
MGEDAYESCEWIEGGLAYNRRSLHTCLIVHHHTGLPFVAEYNGGEVPLQTLLLLREQIRAANRSGVGYHECRGCAHLKKRVWPRLQYPIEIVGIAHYSYCNIKCSYCFLQTQDPASFSAGYKPYSLLPVIRELIQSGQLAPHAIIDWGGGEPTSYPQFDELLEVLLAHGTFHYVHTNGTRFPSCLRRSGTPERVHVICSVDAGRASTYVRIKQKDYLERVWSTLSEYVRVGAIVSLKYIVKEENCSSADLEAFVERAASIRPREVIVDLDYDYPIPSPEVVTAIARLRMLALAAGVKAKFGFTGANFAPEHDVGAITEAAFLGEQQREGRPDGIPPRQVRSRTGGWLSRVTSWIARPDRGWPKQERVNWLDHNLPAQWYEGGRYQATVRMRNEGLCLWLAAHPEGKPVELVIKVNDTVQRILPLPHDVAAGQEATFSFELELPADEADHWEVKLALVERSVIWLEQRGATPLVVSIRKLAAWSMSTCGEQGCAEQATPHEAKECRDANAQTRPDKPAGIGRRLWHLPVKNGARNTGD